MEYQELVKKAYWEWPMKFQQYIRLYSSKILSWSMGAVKRLYRWIKRL